MGLLSIFSSWSLAVFAAFAVTSVSAENARDRGKCDVNLDIYYESLCPDSIYFIMWELGPVYKNLKDFLNVNYVPFGKASWVRGDDDRLEFTCQHGHKECVGNRAQSCALYEIENNVRVKDQQLKKFDLVSCAMSSSDPSSAVPQCAAKIGLDQESISRIENCSNNRMGDELLLRNGEKTKAFESPLLFVPSVVINGEKSSSAFKNLKSVICDKISSPQKSAICGP